MENPDDFNIGDVLYLDRDIRDPEKGNPDKGYYKFVVDCTSYGSNIKEGEFSFECRSITLRKRCTVCGTEIESVNRK